MSVSTSLLSLLSWLSFLTIFSFSARSVFLVGVFFFLGRRFPPLLGVAFAFQNGQSPVNLFQQRDPAELMREGHPGEREAEVGAFQDAGRQAGETADDKGRRPGTDNPLLQ